jgi:hypothetical protein
LAAEIGQNLVIENDRLRKELEVAESNRAIDRKYTELEASYYNLNLKHQALTQEHEDLLSAGKAAKTVESKLAEKIQSLADALNSKNELIDAQEIQIESLKSDKAVQIASSKKLENDVHLAMQKLGTVSATCDNLRRDMDILEIEKIGLQDAAEQQKQAIMEYSQKCAQLEELLEMYQADRNILAERDLQIMDLNSQLDNLNEAYLAIKVRLAVFEPSVDSAPDKGCKTLLGQVEDRRQELEQENLDLSQKHKGLLKIHQISLSQQGKLQNHLNRLKQIASSDTAREATIYFESALAQAESEKKELEERIRELEQRPIGSMVSTISGSCDKDSALLSIMYEQQATEINSLKDQLKTVRLIKQNESDKLFKANRLLSERENELEQLKVQCANAQFQLDEYKLKSQFSVELEAKELDSNEKGSVGVVIGPEEPGSQAVEFTKPRISEPENEQPYYTEKIASPLHFEHMADYSTNQPECNQILGNESDLPNIISREDDNIHREEKSAHELDEISENETYTGSIKKVKVDRTKVQECQQQ